MGRRIDAADTYATVYHTGLSLTRKKVGRGKRAVSYSGLRLAEGFEACRAPNRSGLRSACPCRWPPSAARRSSSLPGTEAVRHRQNPAEPTALRHIAAWGRREGGCGCLWLAEHDYGVVREPGPAGGSGWVLSAPVVPVLARGWWWRRVAGGSSGRAGWGSGAAAVAACDCRWPGGWAPSRSNQWFRSPQIARSLVLLCLLFCRCRSGELIGFSSS